MHRTNYLFIALIFLFAGIYIGMFVTTWHYLDHPVIKETKPQPVKVENNYYIKYYQHFDSEQAPPPTPFFTNPKTARPGTSLRYKK